MKIALASVGFITNNIEYNLQKNKRHSNKTCR